MERNLGVGHMAKNLSETAIQRDEVARGAEKGFESVTVTC